MGGTPGDSRAPGAVRTSEVMPNLTEARVEFFMLADRAEVLGGKLYITGGLLDRFTVASLPARLSFGFALSILLPVEATSRVRDLRVVFRAPGSQEIAALGSQLVTPTVPGFGDLPMARTALAYPQLNLDVNQEGPYIASAILDGHEVARLGFLVQQAR